MGGRSSTESAPAAAAAVTSTAGGQSVKLNVYSLQGSQLGVYHTGVEVLGAEYVFGGGDTSYSGVNAQRPRVPPPGSGWTFYQTVDMGQMRMSSQEAHRVIAEARAEFPGNSYDLVSRNCNTFSDTLCMRLCGRNIPGWINRLAGIGSAFRNVAGMPAGNSASGGSGKAEGGAGGPAAAGLVTAVAAADGDLSGQIDWAGVGILNASNADPAGDLRSGGAIVSDADSAELLLLVPFTSPVKLQAVRLESASGASAPEKVRLFANHKDLDMSDAAGGVAATHEAVNPKWSNASGAAGVVGTSVEVNLLKFQNLGFLCIYLARSDPEAEDVKPISVQRLRLIGKV